MYSSCSTELNPQLKSSTASNGVHGCLFPEIDWLDRRCYHHGVRSCRLHRLLAATQHRRLTFSQVPHLRRGQIPPSRRSIHRLLQRRSGPADPGWRGYPLRPSPDETGPEKARKPPAFSLGHPSRVLSCRDGRLGRQSPHAAAFGQIGERLR